MVGRWIGGWVSDCEVCMFHIKDTKELMECKPDCFQ